jgi:hypothetical protein
MTEWALGMNSTVRIGAGAGRTPVTQTGGDTDRQTDTLALKKTGKGKLLKKKT